MTLCGNREGPNHALPCAREVDEQGRHDGDHTIQPGNPAALHWANEGRSS